MHGQRMQRNDLDIDSRDMDSRSSFVSGTNISLRLLQACQQHDTPRCFITAFAIPYNLQHGKKTMVLPVLNFFDSVPSRDDTLYQRCYRCYRFHPLIIDTVKVAHRIEAL